MVMIGEKRNVEGKYHAKTVNLNETHLISAILQKNGQLGRGEEI